MASKGLGWKWRLFMGAVKVMFDLTGLTRKSLLIERFMRIERWKLDRCNAYVSHVTNSANESYAICNRVKGHPGGNPNDPNDHGHCGVPGLCDYPEHNDICRCPIPRAFKYEGGSPTGGPSAYRRCVCGGFQPEPTQAEALA